MLGYNRLESNFLNRLFFINYLTLLLLYCHVILGMNRMIFIMKYHFEGVFEMVKFHVCLGNSQTTCLKNFLIG